MSRTTRLFSLLQILRRHRSPVTAATLAHECGVSTRTLYRDIAELIAQGAPIAGEAGLGYILRPGLFLPPLMLSDDEIDAVVLGLSYVHQRGDKVLGKAALDVRAKLKAVLPRLAQEGLEYPIVMPGPDPQAFPDNAVDFDVLRTAIRTQKKLRITYTDATGVLSQRTVWPIALGFMNEARLVLAWCETRQDFRFFRTDRIAETVITKVAYPKRRQALLQAWRKQTSTDDARFTADRI